MERDKHPIEADGLRHDGVSTYPADAHDIRLYEDARRMQAAQEVPIFLHAGNKNERLYVACFDGTGNDALRDPAHKTNIALIRDQALEARERGRSELGVGYVEGPGTQTNPVARLIDGATGRTYDARLEAMYDQFIRQSRNWLEENPNAQIRLADIGFSRGAEQAAGFTRLVGERGIADPDSRVVAHDADGRQLVTYSRTLVAPGQVPQVAALIDPVGTGEPWKHDRRLDASVLSATQYTAEDEHRGLFKGSLHMPFGLSENGRLLNVWIPGAHSDAGGGYHLNGLSARTGDLVIGQLNALSETPFLQRRAEQGDPRLDVVHRSEEGSVLYRVWPKVDRREEGGMVTTLAPAAQCRPFDCHVPEPIDAALSARFERRAIGAPGADAASTPQQAVDALFERIGMAAMRGDVDTVRAAGRDYLGSADGQALQAQGAAMADALHTPDHAPQAPVHAAPAMRR
jgi:hypothetical protein